MTNNCEGRISWNESITFLHCSAFIPSHSNWQYGNAMMILALPLSDISSHLIIFCSTFLSAFPSLSHVVTSWLQYPLDWWLNERYTKSLTVSIDMISFPVTPTIKAAWDVSPPVGLSHVISQEQLKQHGQQPSESGRADCSCNVRN